ncbi:hypothetical protein P7F60_11995 [Rhizobium sp. YJ-22]|uniref:hypothetical protein n=1 Tax=Rhizobium sp. YJ-22 TaxID=3037556 RepID=UPI0024128E5F|nr:hypothetical protein [Rhizobium sp. YJ-22]MDG3577114.1 hypothetical protein [Rhizobium sp. YJ-22]
MPRTDGIYAVPSGTKGVTLQAIQSGKYNGFLDDITNDLNAARPVGAGGTGATTPDGAAEALGLISAKDIAGVNTVGGTANAITIVTSRGYDAYAATLYLGFRAASDVAAGGATIDLDGNGAKPLYKTVAAGLVDVNAGDILATGYYWITYDPAANAGGGAFILLNPGNASSAYQVGDFLDSARTLSTDWLRRNGGIYNIADYPELAALLPALPDGVEWVAKTSGVSVELNEICYGEGLFVAVGATGTIITSPDRTNWTVRSSGTSLNLTGVAYGNGIFVAVGFDPNNGQVVACVSPDGVTWSASNITASGYSAFSIAFGNGVFVVVGGSQLNQISGFTSPNGTSWTQRTLPSDTGTIRDVTYTGSLFIAVRAFGASGIYTSPDGTTWTARTSPGSGTIYGVANGASLSIAVGAGGLIISSPDGVAWTSRTSGTSQQLNSASYSPSAKWLVVGNTGTALISSAGTSWALSATGVGTNLNDVVYDESNDFAYVTVGATGTVLTGLRTSPTQFKVPDDDPTYGWIKAVS